MSQLRWFALLGVLAVFGCQQSTGRPAIKSADQPITVAFVSNNAFEFWTFAERGAEKAAAELKDQKVTVEFKRPTKGTAVEQQQILEDLIVKGVDGIAVSPNDAANSMSFYRKKVAPRAHFMTVDSDVPDVSVRRCYLGTHNYRAGRAVGEMLQKALPEGGKIAIFVGKLDVQNAVERRQGVLDVLNGISREEIGEKTPPDARNLKAGKFVLVDTKTDGANETKCQELAEDLLTQNPDVSAVVGLWAYNPPALLRAIEKTKSKAVIVGFDEDQQTLRGIADGKIVGTVVQDPFNFGYLSMKILAGLARGDESFMKQQPGIDSQNRIYVPHRVITKDNVAEFQAEVNKLLGRNN